jgi:hypothetical protein
MLLVLETSRRPSGPYSREVFDVADDEIADAGG